MLNTHIYIYIYTLHIYIYTHTLTQYTQNTQRCNTPTEAKVRNTVGAHLFTYTAHIDINTYIYIYTYICTNTFSSTGNEMLQKNSCAGAMPARQHSR